MGKGFDIFFEGLIILFLLPLDLLVAQPTDSFRLRHNEDRSVTFFYDNVGARRVKILCDCELKGEKKVVKTEGFRSAIMKLDRNGRWTYTTPSLAPGLYTYGFRMKSHGIPDPANPDSIRVGKGKRSVFVVAGNSESELYTADSLYGKLDTLSFPVDGLIRRVLVYTPPNYKIDTIHSWPVLYLLHGLNGNEYAWNNRAHVVQILDNLVRQNRAVSMVLVMPDANPNKLVGQDEAVGLFKNLLCYPAWNKREFEKCFPYLDSCLSSLYKISKNPEMRAVAGLSAGAKQSANLAKMYRSFHYVGLFSPVVGKWQIPDNKDVVFWIGVGKNDYFYFNAYFFYKKLIHKKIDSAFVSTIGGHTWINWRRYFIDFVQFVFKNT